MLHVQPFALPGQPILFERPFPLALECREASVTRDQALSWLEAEAAELDRQAAEHGAVLLRGFPLATAEDFDACVAAFQLPNFKYQDSLSNAVRVNRTERVFTANEAPAEVTIRLHHEMAQTPVYPSRLFFFCEQAAEQGGETPLCRSDALWERLLETCPQFARDCAAKGLQYTAVMPGANDPNSGMGRSWQSTFRADERAAAEARMRELDYRWEWLPDGSLRATTPPLPAVRKLANGRTSFFNQLIAAYHGWKDQRNDPAKAICHGDGTPLDPAAAQRTAELAEALAFDVPWQNGDVVLVDNYVAMHGRRTFVGVRKILASLIAS